jgi:DNA-binding SARP family transcriptional activator
MGHRATALGGGQPAHLRIRPAEPLERVGIRLDSLPGGYALRVSPERCDHLRFGDLVEQGRCALRKGQATMAVDLLRQALGLWRGVLAAEGVPRYGPLARWLGDLEEERLRSVEMLAEAQITVGDPHDAVRELNALLAVAPLRGRAWWLRMLAHHRLGENDNVVTTYREATRMFREELGVDPDPALTDLYRTLLQWGRPAARRNLLRWPGRPSRCTYPPPVPR